MPALPTPQTVVDLLHDELRRVILAGTEAPGTALTEVSVSTKYDVARPTAKAALERLIADGLLVRGGRRVGALVPRLDTGDINDLYSTRATIEIAAYVIVGRSGGDLSAARAANEELAACASREDANGLVQADVTFHRRLVEAAGSRRLSRLHDLLMTEAHLCMAQVQARQLLRGQEIWREHEGLLTAIAEGDASLIEHHTSTHLEHARRKLVDAVSEHDALHAADSNTKN